ncbi:MAG: hypothetical protein R3C32_13350 [Chloroflexota bacterium]
MQLDDQVRPILAGGDGPTQPVACTELASMQATRDPSGSQR